jgi:hypothetical protein
MTVPPNPASGIPAEPARNSVERAPARGQLGIKDRRSFKTWQMASVVIVALLAGMAIGYSGGGTPTAATSTNNYALPPPSGGASTTTTTSGPAGAGTTTTTSAGSKSHGGTAGSTTTTTGASASGTTTTTTPVTGTAQILVPATQMSGNWTSPTFTVAGGTWNIGWAYRCTPAPTSGTAFAVLVVPAGGSPASPPAVSQSAGSGQSITPQSSTGSLTIQVQSPSTCVWAVKVTGVP